MNLGQTWRPGWTIASSIWVANRLGFLALLALTVACAAVFAATSRGWNREAVDAVSVLSLGLALFATFILCGFTETSRKQNGYPTRLFTLPVPTMTLIAAPIFFGMTAISSVYLAWAKLVLPSLGKQLPLLWPVLYLSVGMACYQSVIWSLARLRMARLMVLGVGGSLLAVSWLVFRDDSSQALFQGWGLLPNGVSLRAVLSALLAVIGGVALGVAYWSVASERRGEAISWHGWRRVMDFASDVGAARRQSFCSSQQAQTWFEWRRHGVLLPLSTAGALFLIVAPGPFYETLDSGTTLLTVVWILFIPLLLAFAFGKGFGKADLWSKEPGLPLFLATRSLSNTQWIGAKMKAAAWAAVSSWLLIAVITPWWICMWCDWRELARWWQIAGALYPPPILFAVPALILGGLLLLTWRSLVGSLYIGLSGRSWMLTAAGCGVFATFLGTLVFLMTIPQSSFSPRLLLRLPLWLPWLLAGLFAVKIIAALLLTDYAHRQGWVSPKSIYRYLLVWFGGTAFLVGAVWCLIPIQGWIQWAGALLALFVMPLVRIAGAPIALAQNRQR